MANPPFCAAFLAISAISEGVSGLKYISTQRDLIAAGFHPPFWLLRPQV